jgi:predicted ATPase with chaperone activity
MLARRLPTILPAMSLAEAMETTRIRSVAGITGDRRPWSPPTRFAPLTIPPQVQG